MNIIDRIKIDIDNRRLDHFDKVWRKGNFKVKCQICGATLRSDTDKYCPENCGWDVTKRYGHWICHSCLEHRNFYKYIYEIDDAEGLADIRKSWRNTNG